MPFYKESALAFLDAYDGYLQFHSTTSKLKRTSLLKPTMRDIEVLMVNTQSHRQATPLSLLI